MHSIYWCDLIFNKLQVFEHLSKKYYNNSVDDYRNFLIVLFKQAKSPFLFETEIIHRFLRLIIKGNESYGQLFSRVELQDILLDYFQDYLDNNSLSDISFSNYSPSSSKILTN